MQRILDGKVILITGASRGIGRAVAKALAMHGATVVLLARSIKDLESLYDEILQSGCPESNICPFNLCSATPTDFDDLRLNISNAYGRLDGVIHNAGILGSLTPLEHYNLQTWYQVLQVNLNSSLLLTQACMPLLKKASSGSIVFTLTNLNQQPKANWGAYAVASAGIEAMLHMLAQECENITNIRVNGIQPDKVNTALYRAAYPAASKTNLQEPADLVEQYVYLMSENSKHCNGQILRFMPQLTPSG